MIKKIRSKKDFGECSISSNSINKIVVSRGNPEAEIVIIGEAPGAKEEELGKPFVGRSGKLLDQLLQDVGIDICLDVYFCNVVKCRPPKTDAQQRLKFKKIFLGCTNKSNL